MQKHYQEIGIVVYNYLILSVDFRSYLLHNGYKNGADGLRFLSAVLYTQEIGASNPPDSILRIKRVK